VLPLLVQVEAMEAMDMEVMAIVASQIFKKFVARLQLGLLRPDLSTGMLPLPSCSVYTRESYCYLRQRCGFI